MSFDGETAALYKSVAENHRHPNGPWTLIMRKIQSLSLPENPLILDLASGPGELAEMIAKSMPSATVVSSDISEDMCKAASALAEGIPNLKVVRADLQNLSEFSTGSADVITCCYGFMFPSDKVKAISECLRVLKPGGTLICTYWVSLKVLLVSVDLLRAVLGADEPLLPANPMALAEPGLFESLVRSAGFDGLIDTSESEYPFNLASDKEYSFKASISLMMLLSFPSGMGHCDLCKLHASLKQTHALSPGMHHVGEE
jgi:SAM-dependent methyltransferase